MAADILNQAKLRFPFNSPHCEIWQSCQQRIAFYRALNNRKLNAAEQILEDLQAVDEPEAKIRFFIILFSDLFQEVSFFCFDNII